MIFHCRCKQENVYVIQKKIYMAIEGFFSTPPSTYLSVELYLFNQLTRQGWRYGASTCAPSQITTTLCISKKHHTQHLLLNSFPHLTSVLMRSSGSRRWRCIGTSLLQSVRVRDQRRFVKKSNASSPLSSLLRGLQGFFFLLRDERVQLMNGRI